MEANDGQLEHATVYFLRFQHHKPPATGHRPQAGGSKSPSSPFMYATSPKYCSASPRSQFAGVGASPASARFVDPDDFDNHVNIHLRINDAGGYALCAICKKKTENLVRLRLSESF